MDKILRIQVSGSQPQTTITSIGPYASLGGRGLTSEIISNEVPADCHPLGPENKLVLAPGLLSGTTAACSGRLSVGCKSPLTGGIKEANAGGQAASILAKLGYAALVLEGSPDTDDLFVVRIGLDTVEISRDNSLCLYTNYQLMEALSQEYAQNGAMISIGPAGEMRLANSTVAVTDMDGRPTRHAGRGGVGAVMGAKGIKAILVNGQGTKSRQPKDPDRFTAANKRFVQGLQKNPVTGQGLPTYGTNSLTNVINEAGGYPTYNFKTGQSEQASQISGESMVELEQHRGGRTTHGCHQGCVIRCSGDFMDKDGRFLTKQPEYETVWAHGGNCGIYDLDTIARLDFLDDDLGLDTIEMGATLGVIMEAGLLKFGDAQGALDMVQEIGKGTPLGRLLGSGTETVAKVFGLERAPVVKGQALPAYDPRAIKGIGVTYATSPMGADHTAGYAVASNIFKVGGEVDPLSTEGQVELSRNLQIATAALDSTGMCIFISFALQEDPETMEAFLELINSLLGSNMTFDDVAALGQSILKKERDFNVRAGLGPFADRLPKYFTREPLSPHNQVFDIEARELDSLFNW